MGPTYTYTLQHFSIPRSMWSHQLEIVTKNLYTYPSETVHHRGREHGWALRLGSADLGPEVALPSREGRAFTSRIATRNLLRAVDLVSPEEFKAE